MHLSAIKKSYVVKCPPSLTWQELTAGIAAWWPLKAQSVFDGETCSCVLEARAGGRIYERTERGGEALWGTVLIADPGRRLTTTWHPGRSPGTAQELTLTLHANEGGTRIELEHSGWEVLGARAEETYRSYDTGWDDVIGGKFCAYVNRHRTP